MLLVVADHLQRRQQPGKLALAEQESGVPRALRVGAAQVEERVHQQQAAGFTATVDGEALLVQGPSAASVSFSIASSGATSGSATKTVVSTTSVRFALAGTSRIGESWTVTAGATPYAYTVESPEVIAARLAASIGATVPLRDIAAALAAQLNLAGIAASVDGDALLIAGPSASTVSLSVSSAGTPAGSAA